MTEPGGRSTACRLQLRLVRYYGLESQPDVERFVAQERSGRERVLVREQGMQLELLVCLPQGALAPEGPQDVDTLCQLVEGVSHFVLLAEHARRQLPTTQLALELQAEVDKFLLLSDVDRGGRALHEVSALRTVLFGQVRFLLSRACEQGARYRLANELARHFTGHLQQRYLRGERHVELRAMLREFYRASPADKVAWARAA